MKIWAVIILSLVLACFAWLLSCGVALSYPEMIRYGYTSCSSCHVAGPTGGGATTAYGRMAGEEMATWAPEGSGQVLGPFAALPDWMTVGGDVRYLDLETPFYRHGFVMQADAELAVRASPEVWVDVSAGFYGERARPESRRSFILWTPYDSLSARAGHFFPAYGILLPDHTAATREGLGFGEGQESYNAELSLHGTAGDLTVTEAVQDGSALTLGKNPSYQTSAQRPAYIARASAYLSKALAAGGSYRLALDPAAPRATTFGPFLLWGIRPDLYLLAEADRTLAGGEPPVDVTYAELGFEVYRGVHLQATHEWEQGSRYGFGLQLFPVPHLELEAKAKYQGGLWLAEYLVHLNF